jgi:glycosyltransferase involved in cell wall biosynthesis
MRRGDPRVTVLMPVYNGERFLDEAIASVLGQDFHDLEFVIVDDASTDATNEIVSAWAGRDRRVVLITLDRNLGISGALNRGLAAASAEYVARHDADDIFVDGRLRAQVAALDADPKAVLVTGGCQIVDEEGRHLRTERRVEPPEVMRHLLHFSNALGGHGQVTFRRDVVRAVGGYDERFEASQDYELWTRLERHGRIVTLPIVGMKHRMHGGRVSVRRQDRQRHESLSISQRAISELLDRPIAEHEADSLAAVWRAEHRCGHAAAAHRLLGEAYTHFKAAEESRNHHRRVRTVTAARWARSAAYLARHGHLLEAAVYLGYAARWHPLGAARGLASVARNGAARLGPRAVRRPVSSSPSSSPRGRGFSPLARLHSRR